MSCLDVGLWPAEAAKETTSDGAPATCRFASPTIARAVVCSILASAIAVSSSLAQEAPAPAGAPSTPVDPLRFGTRDRFLKFAPFLQLEGGVLGSSPDLWTDGIDDSDWQVRRATLYTDFAYDRLSGELAVDFATDPHPTITYAYLDYALTDRLKLQVGQQNGIFSLQDATAARAALFDEDGQNTTLQAKDYVGASLRYGGEDFSLSGGVFGTNINVEPFGQGWTLMGRATYAPINRDDAMLHVGIGLIDREEPKAPVAFSGNTGFPLFEVSTISSGRFEAVDRFVAANPEIAATAGRFTFASEYTIGNVDDRERGDALLHGGYASLLAFITDDHREYNAATGTFDRVKPTSPVGKGGFGAVELGGRFDYLDLSDAGPQAGSEIAGTGILNWYLQDRIRVSASYSYTHVDGGVHDGAEYQTALARLWFVY